MGAAVSAETVEFAGFDQIAHLTWADLRAMMGDNETMKVVTEEIVVSLKEAQMEAVEELTPVCGQGAECRDNVMIEVTDTLRNEWELTLQNIAKAIENTFLIADDIMKKALEDMLACDPDCGCEDVLTEYREILNLQDKIQDEIDELGAALALLEGERQTKLGECPEYATIEVEADWAWTQPVETEKEADKEMTVDEFNATYDEPIQSSSLLRSPSTLN